MTREAIHMDHKEAVGRIEANRGFPLLLRDARTFQDLFSESSSWNYNDPHSFPPRMIGENEVGPYCSVRVHGFLSDEAPRFSAMDVVANDEVIAAVAPRIVTPDDHLSFEIILHENTGYALVILQHSYIIGSHWLAYIDPDTIPYRVK